MRTLIARSCLRLLRFGLASRWNSCSLLVRVSPFIFLFGDFTFSWELAERHLRHRYRGYPKRYVMLHLSVFSITICIQESSSLTWLYDFAFLPQILLEVRTCTVERAGSLHFSSIRTRQPEKKSSFGEIRCKNVGNVPIQADHAISAMNGTSSGEQRRRKLPLNHGPPAFPLAKLNRKALPCAPSRVYSTR